LGETTMMPSISDVQISKPMEAAMISRLSLFVGPGRIRFLILAALCSGFIAPAWSAPYDIPQDTASAANSPDEYAWKLFVALNWPADVARKTANPAANFGAEGPAVWETWKNARGEVFRPDGKDPGEWLDQQVVAARVLTDFDTRPLQQIARDRQFGRPQLEFDPAAALRQINETRLNKEAYEFVRGKTLYNLDGQNALFKAGELTITFPLPAKEVKAQWRLITESEKSRYHWATMRMPDNTTAIFGLTALHITTKDLPNWFWATFEHVDNPTRPGNEAWGLESRDRFACPTAPYNCNQAPKGIGLQGTRWENYRLRGTQTDFVDSRATVGPDGDDRLPIFRPDQQSFNGPPDPAWFVTKDASGKTTSRYTQLDFVWSLFRAQPKQ
jgi:hypothetical protein